MDFNTFTIRRVVGAQCFDEPFVQRIHEMTERAMESRLPLAETAARLERANLAHYVHLESGGREQLVGYALNEIYQTPISSRGPVKVNYFCSAFLLSEMRARYSIYRMLGPMRLTGDEQVLMMRTQSPLPIAAFRRLCQNEGFQAYSAADSDLPDIVRAVVANRFGGPELVHRSAYPTRVSPANEPREEPMARLMARIDADRGDALVLVGIANDLVEDAK